MPSVRRRLAADMLGGCADEARGDGWVYAGQVRLSLVRVQRTVLYTCGCICLDWLPGMPYRVAKYSVLTHARPLPRRYPESDIATELRPHPSAPAPRATGKHLTPQRHSQLVLLAACLRARRSQICGSRRRVGEVLVGSFTRGPPVMRSRSSPPCPCPISSRTCSYT